MSFAPLGVRLPFTGLGSPAEVRHAWEACSDSTETRMVLLELVSRSRTPFRVCVWLYESFPMHSVVEGYETLLTGVAR